MIRYVAFTPDNRTKVDGIEAGAQVNNTETVLNTDVSTAPMQFVVDEDSMVSNSPTKVPTQQSVKAYVDNMITAGMTYKGGYNANTNTPNLEVAPTGAVTGDFYVVSVAGTFFSVDVELGDAIIADINNPVVEGDWTVLLRHLDAASIKMLYESNPDTNAFDDAAELKLGGVEALAEVNNISDVNATDLTDSGESTLHYHASDRDRANHTGSQLAATISDFTTQVSGNSAVTANTAKRSYPTGDETKLGLIEPLAEVNNISDINATDLTDAGDSALHYHASDRDRANHTGTQLASTISDFDTEVGNNTAVTANTAKVSASGSVTTHSDVTDAGSGAIITVAERSSLSSALQNGDNVSELVNDAGYLTAAPVGTYGDLYRSSIGNQKLKNVGEILDFNAAGPSNGTTVSTGDNSITVPTTGDYNIVFSGSAKIKKDVLYSFSVEINGGTPIAFGNIESAADNYLRTFSYAMLFSLTAGDEVKIYAITNTATDKDYFLQVGTSFTIIKL